MLLMTALDRANVEILVAQIDPENVGSAKIIQKIGGRQGERMVKAYGLGKEKDDDGNVPEERKRDLVCWYVDRP
jgi:RimJ/RimL family protein N-acetyltransferase